MKMIANYHTHTYRCRHAVGTEEEYIKKAISEGVRVLGFSDHAPYIFEGSYSSYFRMKPAEQDGYFDTLISLREKYGDKIKIHIGYEAEYYPELFSETLKLWEKRAPEYLILGQHVVGKEYVPELFIGATDYTESEERLREYVDLVIGGIETGRFTYVAHPDIINFHGDDEIYRREMTRLILASKRRGMPLEFNLLGMSKKRNYPNYKFWTLAGELSCEAILGCDAHDPERVADPCEIYEALSYLDRRKISVIDEIKLVNPFG